MESYQLNLIKEVPREPLLGVLNVAIDHSASHYWLYSNSFKNVTINRDTKGNVVFLVFEGTGSVMFDPPTEQERRCFAPPRPTNDLKRIYAIRPEDLLLVPQRLLDEGKSEEFRYYSYSILFPRVIRIDDIRADGILQIAAFGKVMYR